MRSDGFSIDADNVSDGFDHQCMGCGFHLAGRNSRIKCSEILADQRFWNFATFKTLEQRIDGCCGFRMWPVIANAVAIGEMALKTQLFRIAMIVFLPVLGFVEKQLLKLATNGLFFRQFVEESCNLIKAVERFTQRERQAGSDFQNGKTIMNQRRQRLNRLIVGRMGFKDELRCLVENAA